MTGFDKIEHRSGFDLWRRFDTVVILTLNQRASGTLSNILAEIRGGCLCDVSWHLLQSRVLQKAVQVEKSSPLPGKSVSTDVFATLGGAGTATRDDACGCARDPRLNRPPFSNNEVYYTFHRHLLRSTQAYIHAVQSAARRHEPCFRVLCRGQCAKL